MVGAVGYSQAGHEDRQSIGLHHDVVLAAGGWRARVATDPAGSVL